MKRSLLVAALSLAFASTAMAAGQDVTNQAAIIVQQQQQTALLQSIDAKLGVQGSTLLAQQAQLTAETAQKGVPPVGAVNAIQGVQALPGMTAIATADRARLFHDLAAHPEQLAEKSRLARLTVDIYDQKDGKDVLSDKMVVTTSSLSPSHAFTGTTVPYRAQASDSLDKDGKPSLPVMKTIDVGTALDIVPLSMGKDQVVLSLGVRQSRLLSMASFEANGLTIDLPSTQVMDQTQGATLKVGQSLSFMGQNGRIVVRLDSVDTPTVGATQVSSR